MKKKKVLLLLLILIPITVKAGVMCNDGWESSCVVSAPGCCSHHGGVAGNNSNYNHYNGETSAQDYLNQKEEQEAMLWIGGIGLVIGFIIFGTIYSKYDEKNQMKIIERRKEEERERLINEQKQKKQITLEKQKKEIGTVFNSKEAYINKLVKQLNNQSLNANMLRDGYFKLISLEEIFENEKMEERYKSFKDIIDVCYNNNIPNIKNKVLTFQNIKRSEMKYFVKIYDNVLTIKDLIKNNKIKYIDLIQNNDNEFIDCSDLIKIYNLSKEVYENVIKSKHIVKYNANDIIHIVNNEELYNYYITYGEKFNESDVYTIYLKIINTSNDDCITNFIDKHKDEFSQLKNENSFLELAYINKKAKTFSLLLNLGYNPNILPLLKDQKNITNILSNNYSWIEFDENKNIYDYKHGVVFFIDEEYCFDLFLKEYNTLKNKNVFYRGESLLIMAIKHNNYKAVEFLLKENSSLFRISNEYSTNGFNPLVYSIYKKHYKITKLLIDFGVNVNYTDIYGNTALDYASSFAKNLELCDYIIQNEGITRNKDDFDLIKKAIKNKDKDILPKINIQKVIELKKNNNSK